MNQFFQNFPSFAESDVTSITVSFFYFQVNWLFQFSWQTSFSNHILYVVVVILQSVWQTFVSSLEVYVRSSIEGVEDPYEGSYDSDGADKSLDSFVIQVNC